MKTSQAYPSKYLSAEDLEGRDVTVMIAAVDLEEIGTGRDKSEKLVITMKGKTKRFVVNKTNANTITKVLGTDETDEWIGQSITIGPREVEFQGDMVMSLRVSLKKPSAAAPQKTQQRKPEPPQDEPSDNDGDLHSSEVPFNGEAPSS